MHRLTYSNVVATIALVAALGGGTAVAATHLAAGSVGSRELRDRGVALRDLAPTARPPSRAHLRAVITDTMTSADVLSALSTAVQGAPGQPGSPGEAGPRGADGAQGPAGTPGIASVTVREATGDSVDSGFANAVARCEDGERVLGGGGRFDADGSARGVLTMSAPDGDAWSVEVNGTGPGRAHAYAVCAKVGA